jgi:hypothetical protein
MARANSESSFRRRERRWFDRTEARTVIRATPPFTDMLVLHVIRAAATVGTFSNSTE